MLRFEFDASLIGRVSAWAVVVAGAQVVRDDESFSALRACADAWRERAKGQTPGQIEEVASARRLYREFGIDPTSTRPSSEALLRRAVKGQALYQLFNVVDVGNWVSLEFQLPLGMYDIAKMDPFEEGHVVVRVGHEGEEFAGIRKGPVHVGGRLCVADRLGAFGSPTSDSLRTSVSEATRELAAIVFAPAEIDRERLESAGRALASRLVEFSRGRLVAQGAVANGPE